MLEYAKNNKDFRLPVSEPKIGKVGIKHKLTQYIMKTCPCNKQGFFSLVKFEYFIRKNWIVFLFLLKT